MKLINHSHCQSTDQNTFRNSQSKVINYVNRKPLQYDELWCHRYKIHILKIWWHQWHVSSPAFILFSSQSRVMTFDPLWLPGHRVTLNLQLGMSRRRIKAKVISCNRRRRRNTETTEEKEVAGEVLTCDVTGVQSGVWSLYWSLLSYTAGVCYVVMFSSGYQSNWTHTVTHSPIMYLWSHSCVHLWFPRRQDQTSHRRPFCFSLELEQQWSESRTLDLKHLN